MIPALRRGYLLMRLVSEVFTWTETERQKKNIHWTQCSISSFPCQLLLQKIWLYYHYTQLIQIYVTLPPHLPFPPLLTLPSSMYTKDICRDEPPKVSSKAKRYVIEISKTKRKKKTNKRRKAKEIGRQERIAEFVQGKISSCVRRFFLSFQHGIRYCHSTLR